MEVRAQDACKDPSASPTTGSVEFELYAGQHYQGRAERVAFDNLGNTWMATTNTLYHIQAGAPKEIATKAEQRLSLAPAGGIYAWLRREKKLVGQFTIDLYRFPTTPLAQLGHPTLGFDGLYLGQEGQLIVTTTPLDDWEGARGRVEYLFWSSSGTPIRGLILPERAIGIPEARGTALLLLGGSRAYAFDALGKELWRYPGEFRKGAVSESAKSVLLNPARKSEISVVHAVTLGIRKIVPIGSPVHHLAISADGSRGAVAADKGQLFLIDMGTGKLQKIALPGTGVPYVTDVRFIDNATIALGVIRATNAPSDKPRPLNFTSASILAFDVNGLLQFRCDFPVKQPAAFMPLIDVTYGLKRFAARTPERVVFVRF